MIARSSTSKPSTAEGVKLTLSDELAEAEARVAHLKQRMVGATCEQAGHDWRHLGGESMVRLGDQGFLLSDGTFAQRKPALIIATEAGQLVKNPSAHSSPISPPSLFSEDMW